MGTSQGRNQIAIPLKIELKPAPKWLVQHIDFHVSLCGLYRAKSPHGGFQTFYVCQDGKASRPAASDR
jgi:hypothetical protein